MTIEKQGLKQDGFCPRTLETFLVHSEVMLGGHDSLRAVLEHLSAGKFSLALSRMEALRREADMPPPLFQAVEHQVYAAICPHH